MLAGALAGALVVGGLGYLGARAWNASLRRQVAARTSQLLASAEEKDRLAASLAARETSLRASEERYALAAEATRDVIWDRDFETNTVLWSAGLTATFGHPIPSADVSSAWWEEKVHPDDRDRVVSSFDALTHGHETRVGGDYRFRRADGTYAHVADRAIVLRDANGRPLRMIGAMTDVTARRVAAAERERLIVDLEAKNAELERFTYTVSHDLKRPLVTIGAYAGMLEKHMRAGDGARFTEDVGRIQRAGERMRQLLDELLELSRVGRIVNAPEDVAMLDLAHEAASLVKGRLCERNIEILISENLPRVRGDRVRLLEVMLNLIDNAAKFAGGAGAPRIEVGVAADQSVPSFYVRDNGIGIDPQHQERVFGLFDKLDLGSEGTGIGLALVRRIVEAHGGRIWIESSGLGRGATFHVRLAA
ncbi:MAG: PAS domain-containing protein [Vicinamibacteria bacterium]|nr:PAS domain-containing protein [Vicinamibacteria bacterium]